MLGRALHGATELSKGVVMYTRTQCTHVITIDDSGKLCRAPARACNPSVPPSLAAVTAKIGGGSGVILLGGAS